MSLEQIWDAVAKQAATITGIKAAYATGTGGQGATVGRYPEQVTDGPVAVVDYDGSEVSHGSHETITHSFIVTVWVPRGNAGRPAAVALLAPMFTRFVDSFDTNVTLFGTADQALVTGSSGFDDATSGDAGAAREFIVQGIGVDVLVIYNRTHNSP